MHDKLFIRWQLLPGFLTAANKRFVRRNTADSRPHSSTPTLTGLPSRLMGLILVAIPVWMLLRGIHLFVTQMGPAA